MKEVYDWVTMKTLFNMLLSIPQTLLGGFVFAHLWNWFIIRKFPTAPGLTYMDAVGLMIVCSFPFLSLHMANALKQHRQERPDVDDGIRQIGASLATIFIIYPLLLLTAYLWHLAIG